MATYTFTNSDGIAIRDTAVTTQVIDFFGLRGEITDVSITLTGLTHGFSEDLDMLLVGPDLSHNLEFWSDVGSSDDLAGNYVISDKASVTLPDAIGISSGSYKPADYGDVETSMNFGYGSFPIAHASPNGTGTFASAFGSTDGNGEWRLSIRDNFAGDAGRLDAWGLTITTDSNDADIVGTLNNDVISLEPSTSGSGTFTVSSRGTVSYSGVSGFIVSGDDGDAEVDRNCGDDTISGNFGGRSAVSGDVQYANRVGINGGDDIMTLTGQQISGDAFNVYGGTLVGGNDVMSISGDLRSTVVGDALGVLDGGLVVGGDDKVTVSGAGVICGDVYYVGGTSSHSIGGDDVIISIDDTANLIVGDSDLIEKSAALVGGNDTIHGGGGGDTIYGDYRKLDEGFAAGGNDNLYGDAGSDAIYGQDGNDLLDGGADIDMLYGGSGDDIYVVDNGGDVVDESFESSGNGIDTVKSSVLSIDLTNTTLFKGVIENAIISGTRSLNLTGNSIANELTGNGSKNTIDGKAGADTMRGLGGDDAYVVDDAVDTVLESAGQGSDTIRTSVSYTLRAGVSVEELRTTDDAGTIAINLTGNSLDNKIAGNAGANFLDGGSGGADVFAGYGGNDKYFVNSAADIVHESTGKGTDIVYSSTDWTLGAGSEVEEIRTTSDAGTAGIDLTGNDLANRIAGNAGVNVLAGKGGNDTLASYGGADRLVGGLGADTLYGGAGNDVFVFDAATESGITSATRDRIQDFNAGDRIDVSDIDAKATSAFAGNQAFVLDTDVSFSIGEIRQTVVSGDLLLEFNTDGDSAAEMSILILTQGSLVSADFVL